MGKIRKYQSCTVVWRNVGIRILYKYSSNTLMNRRTINYEFEFFK